MKKSWLVAKGENANRGVYSVCLGSEQHPATAQDRFLISLCHDTQPQFLFGLLGAAFRLQLPLSNIITTPVSAGGLCSIAVHVLIRRLVVQTKADINFHYYLQCIKWSFWGLTVLWCEHKWNLWEDLKHVDLSLTGQTSYHSKAIFYLHKYIFLPLCCCFDSVVFNTLLNMAWVFPWHFLPLFAWLRHLRWILFHYSARAALSFVILWSLSSLHSQNNPSLCCSRFSVPLFQLSFQFSLNYHHSPDILLRFRMSSKHRSCCLHTPGNALDCFLFIRYHFRFLSTSYENSCNCRLAARIILYILFYVISVSSAVSPGLISYFVHLLVLSLYFWNLAPCSQSCGKYPIYQSASLGWLINWIYCLVWRNWNGYCVTFAIVVLWMCIKLDKKMI